MRESKAIIIPLYMQKLITDSSNKNAGSETIS